MDVELTDQEKAYLDKECKSFSDCFTKILVYKNIYLKRYSYLIQFFELMVELLMGIFSFILLRYLHSDMSSVVNLIQNLYKDLSLAPKEIIYILIMYVIVLVVSFCALFDKSMCAKIIFWIGILSLIVLIIINLLNLPTPKSTGQGDIMWINESLLIVVLRFFLCLVIIRQALTFNRIVQKIKLIVDEVYGK